MGKSSHVAWFVSVVALVSAVAGPAPAQTTKTAPDKAYPIQIERPARKGLRETVELVLANLHTDETKWQDRDPVVTHRAAGGRLVADVEVLDADDKGDARALALTIRVLTRLDEKGKDVRKPVLPAGTKLVAKLHGEKTLFSINGNPVREDVEAVLSRLIYLAPPGKAIDHDALYGSRTPRRVGESWPVNAKAVVEAFGRRDMRIDEDDVSGTVKLAAVEEYEGQPVLRVEANLDVKHFEYVEPTTKAATSTTAASQPATTTATTVATKETGENDDEEGADGDGAQWKTASFTARDVWLLPLEPDKSAVRESSGGAFRFTSEGEEDGVPYRRAFTDATQVEARLLPPGDQAP